MLPLVLMGGAVVGLAYAARSHRRTPWEHEFQSAADRYTIPVPLLKAIARKESGMVAAAISPPNNNGTRDYGLLQVNETNLRRFGILPTDALKPAVGIDAGARVLSEMREYLGDRFSALTWPAAYNVGPDLEPRAVGEAYARDVWWHWTLYTIADMIGG